MKKISLSYLPKNISSKDRKTQRNMIINSRKNYKKGVYKTRKNISSFKNKLSPHIIKAKKLYNIDNITPSKELSNATGCSIEALKHIVRKGQGAYHSSGSRPNQTANSWGIARLASSISGGKAAAYDYDIIKKGCDISKIAYKLAKEQRIKKGWKV
jgi:hypothetical protein